MEKTTRPPEGGQAAAISGIDINQLDVEWLTDCWEARDFRPFLPYCYIEASDDGTQAILDVTVWCAIQKVLDRRRLAADDVRAVIAGYRDAGAALRAMRRMDPQEAGSLYFQVFSE